jgi:hypothetical protein
VSPENNPPSGGELICTFTGKYASEHQIIHLELPTMHKPLVIEPEHLMVPCISESCLTSSFVDKVDIITLELLLCGFVICLNTRGDHSDFWWDNSFGPIHQKESRLPRGSAMSKWFYDTSTSTATIAARYGSL